MARRILVTLDDDTEKIMESIAHDKGCSYASAIRGSLTLVGQLRDNVEEGYSTVVVQTRRGRQRQIVSPLLRVRN